MRIEIAGRLLATMVVAVCCMLLSSAALADCILNGVVYAEGTQLGNLICSGGYWVPG